jgi:hypothetical protein
VAQPKPQSYLRVRVARAVYHSGQRPVRHRHAAQHHLPQAAAMVMMSECAPGRTEEDCSRLLLASAWRGEE